ncbi:hypothetical protein [Flagellimonas oceanensis]|uniref:hypothetical protein n=1 Tax=Flagellimonas oceanensis TaxID=2499163 RepID=UPI000F8E9B58|nr:hypothetical protein [Allomuricauda oceanensis]
MTKTDLFRVIIKTFGIYCFIDALFQLIPNLSYSGGFFSFSLVVSLIYLLSTGLIAYLLLFQTDRLIKFFRLGKGFDTEHVETRGLNANGLFNLGLIMLGLLMIVDNIAQFLNFCYLAFKKKFPQTDLMELKGLCQISNWTIIGGLSLD